jgi:hypothetical protein
VSPGRLPTAAQSPRLSGDLSQRVFVRDGAAAVQKAQEHLLEAARVSRSSFAVAVINSGQRQLGIAAS